MPKPGTNGKENWTLKMMTMVSRLFYAENQIMSDAVKQRTILRGCETRTSGKLDQLCMGKQVDRYVLSDSIEEFDKDMDKFDNVQSQIGVEMEIEQLDQDIHSTGNIRDKVRFPR